MKLSKPGMNLSKPWMNLSKPGEKTQGSCYKHTQTQKGTNFYEYYLVCNGNISMAGRVAQTKVWINNLLITRYD